MRVGTTGEDDDALGRYLDVTHPPLRSISCNRRAEEPQVVGWDKPKSPDGLRWNTQPWFSQHPEVEIVSRDRCGIHAQDGRHGAPQARQVADALHLLQNLRDAVERQVSCVQTPSLSIPVAGTVPGS